MDLNETPVVMEMAPERAKAPRWRGLRLSEFRSYFYLRITGDNFMQNGLSFLPFRMSELENIFDFRA
jgi:hypothetical protein